MLIKLDSSLTTQDAHNFEVTYSNFELDRNTQYEAALVSSQFFYSFFNISSEFNNNNLRYQYSTNGGTSYTNVDVNFDDGIYSISQINDKLASVLALNSHTVTQSGIVKYPIVISPNFSTLRCDSIINNSLVAGTIFKLDFTTSNSLRSLLGYTSVVLSASGTGANFADITRGVTSLVIHSSIVKGSYENSSQSDVLFSSQPNAAPGGLIEFKPSERVYLPLSTQNEISRIRMTLTDQQNRPVKINDVNGITYLLHLRAVK